MTKLAKTLITNAKLGLNTFVYGPTGTGKTRAAIDAFDALIADGVLDAQAKIPLSPGVEDVDLTTRIVPSISGKLEERPGLLRAVFDAAREKRVGLLVDEINRATPRAINLLISALDPVHGVYRLSDFIKGDVVEVPLENLFVVATANMGGEYSGTSHLDAAMMDRFGSTIYHGYDRHLEADLIDNKQMLKVAAILREAYRGGKLGAPLSTRQLIGWKKAIDAGMDPLEAARSTWVHRLVAVDAHGFPAQNEVELIVETIEDNIS